MGVNRAAKTYRKHGSSAEGARGSIGELEMGVGS